MLGSLIGLASRDLRTGEPIGPSPITQSPQGLEQRLQALEMACAGLWHLLKTKHGYTDEELVQTIHALDAADGALDGRITHAIENCPTCGRQLLTQQRKRCVWCGADLPEKPF